MDKIHFPYRADSHLRLLHVIEESGAWEKQGLDVEYNYCIDKDEAHKFWVETCLFMLWFATTLVLLATPERAEIEPAV